MKTQVKQEKWLVFTSYQGEVLDAKVANNKWDAMEEVKKVGENGGGEFDAHVVPLNVAATTPELLEALKRVMDQVIDTGTVNQIEGAKAMAAIAKAEGR